MSFNASYESMGIERYYKSLSEDDRKKISTLPNFSVNVYHEKDLWDNAIFNPQKIKYATTINDLQEEGKAGSAGICPFCKSTKTMAQRKQLKSSDEMVNFIIYCYNCSRTHIR